MNSTIELSNGFVIANAQHIQNSIELGRDMDRSDTGMTAGIVAPVIFTTEDNRILMVREKGARKYRLPFLERSISWSRIYTPQSLGYSVIKSTFEYAKGALDPDEMYYLGILKEGDHDQTSDKKLNIVAPVLVEFDTESGDDGLSLLPNNYDGEEVEGLWLHVDKLLGVIKTANRKRSVTVGGDVSVNRNVATILRFYYENDTEEVPYNADEELFVQSVRQTIQAL